MQGIRNTVITALLSFGLMGIQSASIGGVKTQRDVESTQTSHGRCHWYRPCGGEIEQVQINTTPSGQTFNQAYRDMAVKAFGLSRQSQDLKISYIKRAMHDPEFASLFDAFHFNKFPVNQVTDSAVEFATEHTDTFLVQTYQEMATISVYLNRVRLENKHWSVGGNSMFYTTIDQISIQYCDLMCSLNIHIKATKGLVIPETVTEDVIDPHYDNLGFSETYKYVRDYIIIRDYSHYLNYLGEMMQELENLPSNH